VELLLREQSEDGEVDHGRVASKPTVASGRCIGSM
jgi:hypothetical protein